MQINFFLDKAPADEDDDDYCYVGYLPVGLDQNSNVNYYPCCHADDDARDLIAQKPGDAVDVAGV